VILFPKRGSIGIKESAILLTFLAIILLLPLGVLQIFGNAWSEVSWQDTTDIAMLEWTGAFFHVFLFLLLLEQFKATQRLMFVFMGCGFLGMGILNFFYALSLPGSEIAMWTRAFSLLLGSVFFSFSIPSRKKLSSDIPGAIIKFVIPTVLLAALIIWVSSSLDQVLPDLLTSKGHTSLFGQLFLVIPCAFFFFTALCWLHEYIKNQQRVDFLFAIVVLVYAQMTLLIRGANTWGIIWWLLHIVILLDVLIACVYMLVLSVYRSLVWKLIFSLGLAFSLTVLGASGIIQSYSEKKFLKNFQVNLHERHRRVLLEAETNFDFSQYALKTMQSDAKELYVTHKKDFRQALQEYLNKKSREWAAYEIEFGFCPVYGKTLIFPDASDNRKGGGVEALKKLRDKLLATGSKSFEWSSFYYDNFRKSWVSTLSTSFQNSDIEGIFFVTLDVVRIRNPNILRKVNIITPNGCIVFNRKTGKILCDLLPELNPVGDKIEKQPRHSDALLRKLVASAIDVDSGGRILLVNMRGNQYYISAHLLQSPDWGVLNIVDVENFPVEEGGSKYFFIAVGMLTLLWGFVILLLLLQRQLSRPLGKLLNATEQLEAGNFDINVDIHDGTELGVISRSFNHMVLNLKDLYSDLASTVQDRTEALEDVRKADSAKITFFQNISHELRTPMHGILSFARLGVKLDSQSNPEKVTKYFKNINTSAERLMQMIDSIMDLAKMESGHMTFFFQSAKFLLPIHQIKEELNAAFIEKGVELIIPSPGKDLHVAFDTEMLSRVYRNLLGNALKMSKPESKVIVQISENGDIVKVSVLDRGPGIPEDEIKNIFDKFVQAGEGRKRGGTGLGLALCREIIFAHNGRIWAENRDGGGACFSFEIPLNNIKETYLTSATHGKNTET
jgi:signal transduction histidine kinase